MSHASIIQLSIFLGKQLLHLFGTHLRFLSSFLPGFFISFSIYIKYYWISCSFSCVWNPVIVREMIKYVIYWNFIMGYKLGYLITILAVRWFLSYFRVMQFGKIKLFCCCLKENLIFFLICVVLDGFLVRIFLWRFFMLWLSGNLRIWGFLSTK